MYVCTVCPLSQVADGEGAILSVFNFDVLASYSSWQCVELLLTHLPMLKILLSVLIGAYKKVGQFSQIYNVRTLYMHVH